MTDEAIGARQMHHSVRTGQLVYGRTEGQFAHLTKDMQDIYVEFSIRWHQYIGTGYDFDAFWHLYPSIPASTSLMPTIPEPPSGPQDEPTLIPTIRPDQPALSARFGLSTTIPVVSIGLLESWKSVQAQPSTLSYFDTDRSQLDALQLFKDYSQVLRAQPIHPQTDVLLCLFREFLGIPEAMFQSDRQREALLALVLNLEPSLFLVLPTGGGKTTLFLLCASLSTSQITLLVVPLVSLRENLVDKAKRLQLRTTIWEQDGDDAISQHYGPHLVLVSAETAITTRFYARVKALGRRVDRIIFDEAHLIHTACHYRTDFQSLRTLTSLGRPLVFTTATLSGSILDGIRHWLTLIDNPRVIRQSINKPNLRYRVKNLSHGGNCSQVRYNLVSIR